ncbi:MAG TPA: hypothetical protein VMU39_01730 [Solirubrobacteraceae bacterium]|nr:hypothetical protein [Solirubrobacteraceae bacterium]
MSVDNLFVFVIIIGAFAVPAEQQPKVLTIGIVIALALRVVFIALGAALLVTFSFMFLIFGLTLLATAVQLYRHRNEDPTVEDNALVAAARRKLPITDTYDDGRIITRLHGRRAFYFLIAGLLRRLVYLSTGLAAILAFIGAKLVLEFAHQHHHSIPEIPTGPSLAVLAATTVASLIKARRDPSAHAHAGALRQHHHDASQKPSCQTGTAPLVTPARLSRQVPRTSDRSPTKRYRGNFNRLVGRPRIGRTPGGRDRVHNRHKP